MYSVAIEVGVHQDLPDPSLVTVHQVHRARPDRQDPSSRDPSCLDLDLAFQPDRIHRELLRARQEPSVPYHLDLEDHQVADP